MKNLSYFFALIIYFLPRRIIELKIARYWSNRPDCSVFISFFSGRVALFRLASNLPATKRKALIPEYLCNVVALAFERAGFEIATYGVDDSFEPFVQEIESKCNQDAEIGAIVLAPLYGASGASKWASSSQTSKWRNQHELALIVDLCQDFSRAENYPRFGNNFALLVSLNDKSFPGVMGGGMWTDIPLKKIRSATFHETAGILLLALTKVFAIRKLLRKLMSPKRRREMRTSDECYYDHSKCMRFPYDFEHYSATKYQIAMGYVGIKSLSFWIRRRGESIKKKSVVPAPMPHIDTSPFLVTTKEDPGLHRWKRPYGLAHNFRNSVYPLLTIRHNKGFDDL